MTNSSDFRVRSTTFLISTVLIAAVMAVAAAAQVASQPTAATLDPAIVARHEAAIIDLETRQRSNPGDADAQLWIGRHLGYLGRYEDAIAAFTSGLEQYPEDARFLRHRGHRHLSLRALAAAVVDFERGLAKVAGRPDRVEPDGLPNHYNRPTSTLKTNLWYHLGVARYVQHDFARASEAFLACAALADNDDMLVAAGYWRYLALRREDRDADAAAWLASLPSEPRLIENDAYGRLLTIFRTRNVDEGVGTDDALGAATYGYGLGAWHFVEGREETARAIWKRVLAGSSPSAFGVLAAEAEAN